MIIKFLLIIELVIPNYPEIDPSPIYLFIGVVVYKVDTIKGPVVPIAAGLRIPLIYSCICES